VPQDIEQSVCFNGKDYFLKRNIPLSSTFIS